MRRWKAVVAVAVIIALSLVLLPGCQKKKPKGNAFFALFGTVALIAIPNFIALRSKAYDASAQAAGYNAKIAEEVYFQNAGDIDGRYTASFKDLLEWDKNLTDDPSVTFVFGDCNASGYTFTTSHAQGKQEFVFTD